MPTFTRERSEAVTKGGVSAEFAKHSPDRLLDAVRSRYAGDPRAAEQLLAALNHFLHSQECVSAQSLAPLACALDATMNVGGQSDPPDAVLKGARQHAIAGACAAETLAGDGVAQVEPRLAMAGSLFHNVGQVALASVFPKAYARVLDAAHMTGDPICDIERSVFGIDHCVVGKRLAEWWGLPVSLHDCMWLHHHPQAALRGATAHAPLVLLVSAATELARRCGFASMEASNDAVAAEALAGFDVPADSIESLAGRMRSFVDEIEASLVSSQRYPGSEHSRAGQSAGVAGSPIARAVDRLMSSCDVDTVATCRTLVSAFTDAIATDAVLAFVVDANDPARIVCSTSASSAVEWIVLPELGEQAANVVAEVASAGTPIVPVPASLDPLVARLARSADRVGSAVRTNRGADVHLFAVVAGQELHGGVLFVPADGDLDRIASLDVAWLATACASAIHCARFRNQLATQSESLADLNRRLHSADDGAAAVGVLHAMARMAAGAAHELNNPLAVIAGRAQMLCREGAGDDLQRHLEIIDEQARRASEIVSELLAFAKPDPPAPRTLNLRNWAESLRQHWQRVSTLRADQFDVTISDAAATLFVDPVQLDEAAGAVISNAIEAATPENTRLVVNSDSGSSDDTVVVSFRDNGRGMTPDVLAHALDPFFSHRPAGRGRGLGLSRAARLVEVNGGRMWIESRPGCGTTVYVAVPSRPA